MEPTRMEAIVADIVPHILTRYGMQVLGAILILVIGGIVAGFARGLTRKGMTRANADPTITAFLSNMVRWVVLVFAVIAALAKFGIQTTSFIAVLGAAGFAVGLSLQGSLSNFASGVLILLFRPFKLGDVIDAAGVKGKVVDIGILTTILNTPDNQKIIIPNSGIMGGTITNVNAYETRRVDLVAGIGYDDDIAKAHSVLEGILANHPKVLSDPAPAVAVSALADSSVNFNVRPWCKSEDYWTVYLDVTRSIKEEFDKNGISIPFPQRDVHMHQVAS